jgi:lipopolysaccharide export system protein LptC
MAGVESDMAAGGVFGRRSARQYELALRHSRRVAWLKFLLPAASLGVIAAFIAVSWLARVVPDNMSIDRTSIENGTIVMDNPVLTGQTDNGRTFTVRARQASQSVGAPDVITLSDIGAALPVTDEETAEVIAESGIYDRGSDTLTLDAPFRVESSNGLTVEMRSARFDLGARSMASKEPVTIRNGETSLVADSVRMQDNGDTIIFSGGVVMTIDPSTIRDTQEAQDTQEDGD